MYLLSCLEDRISSLLALDEFDLFFMNVRRDRWVILRAHLDVLDLQVTYNLQRSFEIASKAEMSYSRKERHKISRTRYKEESAELQVSTHRLNFSSVTSRRCT